MVGETCTICDCAALVLHLLKAQLPGLRFKSVGYLNKNSSIVFNFVTQLFIDLYNDKNFDIRFSYTLLLFGKSNQSAVTPSFPDLISSVS